MIREGLMARDAGNSSPKTCRKLLPEEQHPYYNVRSKVSAEVGPESNVSGSAPITSQYGKSIEWNSPERYEIVSKIGRGQYSDVFLVYDSESDKMAVAKVLKPVKKEKILREYAVLTQLKGGPNIVELIDAVRSPTVKRPAFIFEYVETVNYRVLAPILSDLDIRHYLYQVLLALEYAHSHGIMHRDVKPSNMCIDHKQRKVKLIDWGLAELFYPDTPYNVRVASRFYKGPELLVEMFFYDYRLDMWSFGCVLGGLIFMLDVLFRGSDNRDQLTRIVSVLGSEDIKEYLQKFQVPSQDKWAGLTSGYPKKSWSSFVNSQNQHLCCPEALDLLDSLLQFDHTKRIQAREALLHPYFDPVRPTVYERAEGSQSVASAVSGSMGSPEQTVGSVEYR